MEEKNIVFDVQVKKGINSFEKRLLVMCGLFLFGMYRLGKKVIEEDRDIEEEKKRHFELGRQIGKLDRDIELINKEMERTENEETEESNSESCTEGTIKS